MIETERNHMHARFQGHRPRRLSAYALAFAAAAAMPGVFGDLDTVGSVLVIVLLVICLGIHEAAHAWVAWKCGDSTGKDLGRITLNPIPHIDLFMSIILPGILLLSNTGVLFGGAKPVPVNFHRLRHPWRDMSLVALAGPASNLLLALFFLIALKFFVSTGLYNNASSTATARYDDVLPVVLSKTVKFNLLLTVFNLVPIPPLDGSRVMAWLLPPGVRTPYVALEPFGLLIVMALVYFSHDFNYFLVHTMDSMFAALDKIASLGGVW